MLKGRVRIDLVALGGKDSEASRRIDLHAAPTLNVVDREVIITRLADPDSSEEDDDEREQE